MSDNGVGGLGSYEQMFGPRPDPLAKRWVRNPGTPRLGLGVSRGSGSRRLDATADVGRGIAMGRNLGPAGAGSFTDAIGFFNVDPETGNLDMGGGFTNSTGRVVLKMITEGNSKYIEILDAALDLENDDPDLVIQLQAELILHGFLDASGTDGPLLTWGVMDDPTKLALRNMSDRRASRPGQSWDAFLDNSKKIADNQIDAALAQMDAEQAGQGQDLADALSSQLVFTKSDPLAIRQGADEMARQLMGNTLERSQLDEIVNAVHAKEREMFYGSAEYQGAKARIDQYTSMTLNQSGASDDELNRFMTAIETIESNGNPTVVNQDSKAFGLFQFTPGTWAQETARFKLDPNDKSPENQRRVAAAAMSRYYRMFGDWRRVAVAWYAGEGSKHVASGGRSSTNKQGKYISIDGYATKAMELMGGTRGTMQASMSSNPFMASIGRAATRATEAARTIASMDGDPMATLSVTEQQDFDLQAYVQNLVEQKGGLDMNSYQFLQHALTFEDLIRESI